MTSLFMTFGLALIATCQASQHFPRDSVAPSSVQAATTSQITTPAPEMTPPPILSRHYSGIDDDDLRCWSSYIRWSSISTDIAYRKETEPEFTEGKRTWVIPTSYETGYWYTSTSYPPYTTLCDGYARAVGTRSYNSSRSIYTHYNVTTATTYLPPTPTCTIDSFGTVCDRIFSTLTDVISKVKDWNVTTVWPRDDLQYITTVLSPPCRTLENYATASSIVTCSVPNDGVSNFKAYYWPVSTVGGLCANGSISTIQPAATIAGRPNTADVDEMEMTSGSIYYYMENVQLKTLKGRSAGGDVWLDYGTPLETATFSEPQDLVSSIIATKCYYPRHGHRWCAYRTEALDLANLQTAKAVPYFNDLEDRRREGNKTIYQDQYTPYLTFPPVGIKSADPAWAICDKFVSDDRTPYSQPVWLPIQTEEYDPNRVKNKVAKPKSTHSKPQPGASPSNVIASTTATIRSEPSPTSDSDGE
ncbi:hypothetical protein BGZ60DRAFT_435026 [Tricladium varicosporioides]|nr:hypothetical protein BGZ60DRAFT_435026 [Hymenoscyphus varicosporioides]